MSASKITIPGLRAKKTSGERITMLTCYDATFAHLLDAAGIEILLIGDSLGMVIQGEATTLPVTLEHVLYHTQCVTRTAPAAHVVTDMPFMSYQSSTVEALRNAGRLLKEGKAEAVKLEGGHAIVPTVMAMTQAGIPVMAHIGLRPQTVLQMGGYKIQGRTPDTQAALIAEGEALEAAGAYAIVLEGITSEAAAAITARVTIPTIGIGAGPHCDGQVLVLYDLLGMNPNFSPRFVKPYASLAPIIRDAAGRYAAEVKSGHFPTEAHAAHQTTRPRICAES
ncbi:MAG: 3-methyl-2-oxobutanoate hydroxymethyltransferase [Deltaproteobacteria bacterium]|nr:3-methyl-2-oxobutanoate hydroxymethyltransferase [Deltaproteobacteria bacterium]